MHSRTLMEGMECLDNFTADCLKPQQRSYFVTLYTGTERVISDLCDEGSYQSGELECVGEANGAVSWGVLQRL